MQNKLDELTKKIYSEGVSKANDDAKEIINKATKEAEGIINNSKKEATKIIENAKKKSEEIKLNIESEMKLSVNQTISSIKQQITNLITLKAVEETLDKDLKDKDFIKQIIIKIVENWNPAGSERLDLNLLLPEKDRDNLGKYFQSKEIDILKASINVAFDKNIDNGFKIGPKDNSFVLSFTDEDFKNFFKAYLRPRTTQLLFK
ncbi:MAG: V-type ATP synthase subunit E [Bacteroidetes bacterium]|nr:MAG: V-type ATP synthase subunit E [Bacteroidota bacterium]